MSMQRTGVTLLGAVLLVAGCVDGDAPRTVAAVPVARPAQHSPIAAPKADEPAKPVPELATTMIEDPDPNGPYGAKEVGQGPLLPVPPAVANAVYDAVGVRIDEVPITPEKVLKALKEKAKGRDGRFGPGAVPSVEWPEPLRVLTPAEGGDGKEMPRVAVHS
jgi:hypothetical protein